MVVVLVVVFISGREFIVVAVVWLTRGVAGVLPVMSVHNFIHYVGCVFNVCFPNAIYGFHFADPHVQADDIIDSHMFIGGESVEFIHKAF